MRIIKKVIIWILAGAIIMFIGCWALSTVSRIHIGQQWSGAVVDGFIEVADQIGTTIGVPGTKVEPEYVFDFKNGNVQFNNTHISW